MKPTGIDDDEYLTTVEAAKIIKFDWKTLRRWRSEGTGPVYFKINNTVRYRRSEIDKWVKRREAASRREPTVAS